MSFLVRVVNEGAIAVAAGVVVRFEVEDGSHLVAGETSTTGLLLPGESEEVSVTWNVPDGVREVELTAVVDPPDGAGFGEVRECDEANNRAGPVRASCEGLF